MRRRAQASIIAALFVLVALAILAVGFANVLMAQQNYAAQFQQSVQTDQMRSAESLTITGYSYSNGVYTIYVRNNAPFTSYILRAYYYTSSTFGWSWVNESVGPGATAAVNLSTGPLQSPSFAVVTALGNVFTYKPAPPLPMPATYTGRIWGGDKYSYAGNTVVRTVSGELFFYNSSSGTISPWQISGSGGAAIVVNDARYELKIYPGYSGSPPYPYTFLRAGFNSSVTSAVLVVDLKYSPPYTFTYANKLQYKYQYALYSQLIAGFSTNPSQSGQNVPIGYGGSIFTSNYYNSSTLSVMGSRGSNLQYYNDSQSWLSPYAYHALKFVGNAATDTYQLYLDGALLSYHRGSAKNLQYYGVFLYVLGGPWYVTSVSAYTNDTITVYNVPAGWKVEVIGTDAIGRPVFLEAINTATAPSTVTINIDNYYAPITGQLAVTP
ncbi:MAG: hypothetical protein ACP5GG_01660 [Conexivisphaera sp.]